MTKGGATAKYFAAKFFFPTEQFKHVTLLPPLPIYLPTGCQQTQNPIKPTTMTIPIPLFVPNLIGYLRLFLLYIYITKPTTPLSILLVSLFLDFFDGYLARKLNQCSRFGEVLDVFIDNVSRLVLYIHSDHPIFAIFSIVEGLTACCTLGFIVPQTSHWKDVSVWEEFSPYSKFIMKGNFRTLQGVAAVGGGLFGFPFVLHVWGLSIKPFFWLTMSSRIFVLVVEIEILYRFLLAPPRVEGGGKDRKQQ